MNIIAYISSYIIIIISFLLTLKTKIIYISLVFSIYIDKAKSPKSKDC